jgi:hypothetical protein
VVVDVVPIGLLPQTSRPPITRAYGVGQHLAAVEAVAPLRVPGAVHPEAVLERLDVEVEHHHRVDVADAELGEEGDLHHRLGLALAEQDQRAAVAWLEKTEKLTPLGTRVAPNGNTSPARTRKPSCSWVG